MDNWTVFGEDIEWTIVPLDTAEKIGLTNMQGEITQDPLLGPYTAAIWNDDYNASFATIAELIKYFGEFYA